MTIAYLLEQAQKLQLRPEMEVFLAHLLNLSRLDLVAHGEIEIPVEKLSELQTGWAKLVDGYPVAYLTHKKEFFGLPLYVTEDVLIPRDATERLVERLLQHVHGKGELSVLELGTGSGAIAIALKKSNPSLRIVATDVSQEALDVASKNILDHEVDVELLYADLLDGVPDEAFDVLVANLPYIGTETNNFIADNVAKHEPEIALYGGSDGLQLYRRVFEQIREQDRCFQSIMGEIGFTQGRDLQRLAEELLPEYECQIHPDYQELDRHFILIRK